MGGHRYSLDRLAAAVGMTLHATAKAAGLSGTAYKTARELGLDVYAADRSAVRLGLHPYEVWPEMLDHILDEQSRPCDDCGTRFIPGRRDGRFCSQDCNRRWWARESRAARRRERPEVAERARQRRRAGDRTDAGGAI